MSKVDKSRDYPNITKDFYRIGVEEAALILGEVDILNETVVNPAYMFSDDPRAVAEALNLLYTQEDFFDLMRTEVGKGVIIGSLMTSYLYSNLMRTSGGLNETTDVYGTVQSFLKRNGIS